MTTTDVPPAGPTPGAARARPVLPHVPALDGLRGAAVLAVVLYHYDYSWASGGFLGVDTFFVLSGYLITTLLVMELDGTGSIGLIVFWGRRIRRLLPALLLVLVAVGIASWLFLPTMQLDRIRGDGLASLFYVANWRFVLTGQSYFDLFTGPSPVRHLWSLAIEEQFYLVWPLVFIVAVRSFRRGLRALTWVCVAGIAISTVLMAVFYDRGNPSRAYFGTDSRVHTILVGCLLALVLTRVQWRPEWVRRVRVGGTVAMVGTVIALLTYDDLAPFYYRGGSLLFAVVVAVLIAALVQPTGSVPRQALSARWLCWFGLVSYGVYLWHWPVNTFMTVGRVGIDGSALNALRFAVTIALATASFYLVELPIRKHRRAVKLTRAWAPVGIIVAGLVLLGTTAAASEPPNYLGGTGFLNGLPCGPAGATVRAEANRAVQDLGPLSVDAAQLPQHLLVVGDSHACSLTVGLRAYAPQTQIADASVVGCGGAAGQLYSSNEPFPSGSELCQDRVRMLIRRGASPSTDAVVWLSNWEGTDQVVNGKLVRFRTRAGRRLVMRQLEDVRRIIREHTTAPLVLLTVAAPSTADEVDGKLAGKRSNDSRYVQLNKLLRKFAARHPNDVQVVDLAHRLCPSGPPCGTGDGFNARSVDGRHFNPEGSVWAARWLYPRLARLPQPQPPPAG